MSTNGAADAMATDWRAKRATSTEPWIAPASRQTAAAAPVKTPHTMTFHAFGCRLPLVESMPITTEAASAPLTKNSATRMIAIMAVSQNSGNCCNVANSAAGWLSAASFERFATPESCRFMAAPPRTENHTKLTTLGAMNTPTNGAQLIHHAQ